MVKRKVKKNDSKNTIKIISITIIVLAVIFAAGYVLNKNTELTGWVTNTGGSGEVETKPACPVTGDEVGFIKSDGSLGLGKYSCKEPKSCGVGAPAFGKQLADKYECGDGDDVCCITEVKGCPSDMKTCDDNPKAKSVCCDQEAVCGEAGGMVVPHVNFCIENDDSCESPKNKVCGNEDKGYAICCPDGSECGIQAWGLPYCKEGPACEKGDSGYCLESLCCSDKEECVTKNRVKTCQPKDKSSCEVGETYCSGTGDSAGREICCPAETPICLNSANGYPYCKSIPN